MDKEPHLKFSNRVSPHLSPFFRARVLQSLRDKSLNIVDSTQSALECARTLGLPSLREEATTLLEKPDRVGAEPVNGNLCSRVSFGCPKLLKFLTATPVCIDEFESVLYDFGDTIPQLPNGEIF